MFRRHPLTLDEVLNNLLRANGLETPLQQHRLIAAWDEVAGPAVRRQTKDRFIKNQTLFIKILNAALRQELAMRRQDLARRLNEKVGAQVIADIRFY